MVLFSDLLRSEEKKVEKRKSVFFENQQLDDMAQHFVNLHRYLPSQFRIANPQS